MHAWENPVWIREGARAAGTITFSVFSCGVATRVELDEGTSQTFFKDVEKAQALDRVLSCIAASIWHNLALGFSKAEDRKFPREQLNAWLLAQDF